MKVKTNLTWCWGDGRQLYCVYWSVVVRSVGDCEVNNKSETQREFFAVNVPYNITRKMEYNDSSILRFVHNIYTTQITIEVGDHRTRVVGFKLEMTWSHWSTCGGRLIFAESFSGFFTLQPFRCPAGEKKCVVKWDEGLNGESFPSNQGSFNVS